MASSRKMTARAERKMSRHGYAITDATTLEATAEPVHCATAGKVPSANRA
jgi:hypothetical protein